MTPPQRKHAPVTKPTPPDMRQIMSCTSRYNVLAPHKKRAAQWGIAPLIYEPVCGKFPAHDEPPGEGSSGGRQ
jgi:hypothetical protein